MKDNYIVEKVWIKNRIDCCSTRIDGVKVSKNSSIHLNLFGHCIVIAAKVSRQYDSLLLILFD